MQPNEIILTARTRAKQDCRIVRVGKLLRSEGWVLNGQLFQTDFVVYPNGKLIPTTTTGRKVLKEYV